MRWVVIYISTSACALPTVYIVAVLQSADNSSWDVKHDRSLLIKEEQHWRWQVRREQLQGEDRLREQGVPLDVIAAMRGFDAHGFAAEDPRRPASRPLRFTATDRAAAAAPAEVAPTPQKCLRV